MFKGRYYKHQKDKNSVCIIAGSARDGDFLQIIANGRVYHYDKFPNCSFSDKGVYLDLPEIKGEITYKNLTPLKRDIMGFFRFFPLQCRHYIFSMHHELEGGFNIEGKFIDFSGGKGYMEGDSGRSFPRKYLWIHCNDFPEKCSITASVADIPFLGFHFLGCICAVIYAGKEYRLATYKGVKIESLSEKELTLSQKKLRLVIETEGGDFLPLKMPVRGKMSAVTHESNSTRARFRLFEGGKQVFDFLSDNVSFEYSF